MCNDKNEILLVSIEVIDWFSKVAINILLFSLPIIDRQIIH